MKFPHIYLYLLSGNCEGTNNLQMELKELSVNYITPHMEIIDMEVENAILSASDANVEKPVEGEESDW